MAENLPQTLNNQFSALSRLTAFRQFGLVLGLAVVAALGVGVVRWSMQPNFVVLTAAESRREFIEARQLIENSGIAYQVDEASNTLLVAHDRLHDAESILLDEGLLASANAGYELLDEDRGLGASQSAETMLQIRALQGEIARTIENIEGIDSAQVFLALPRDSVYALRDEDQAKASVQVNLKAGWQLSSQEIEGIVHHVAYSVPGLEASRVTVTDQRGRLLSQGAGDPSSLLRSEQLAYTKDVEERLRQRAEAILIPIVGVNGVSVEVTADIDFTEIEVASEVFDEEAPAIANEAISENESTAGAAGGVPGSLTNQPPDGGVVAADAQNLANGLTGPVAGPQSSSRSSTRNFLNDRTVSHTRQAPARLNNLSVSVLIDYRDEVDAEGELGRVARTQVELDEFAELVRDAIGFDEARGDTLTIRSASFRLAPELDPPPPVPLWQQPWVLQIARYAAGAIGLLLLVMMVLRPVLRSLATAPPPTKVVTQAAEGVAVLAGPDGASPLAPANQPSAADEALNRARQVAEEDPRLVAQVVRSWMDTDGK